MDTRKNLVRLRRINGTIAPDDSFDIYAATGKEPGRGRVPPQLHDGTGRAWVSSASALIGDPCFDPSWPMTQAQTLTEVQRGYWSIKPDAPPLCARTLARWLPNSATNFMHRVGNLTITAPGSAHTFGVWLARHHDDISF